MLYNLLVPLADSIPLFNLFRYLTFRSGGAVITALTIAFLIGPAVIEWLRSRQGEGQPIRRDGPEGHLLTKKGTPTLGGVLILIELTIAGSEESSVGKEGVVPCRSRGEAVY